MKVFITIQIDNENCINNKINKPQFSQFEAFLYHLKRNLKFLFF
jgi:hypothetical protein